MVEEIDLYKVGNLRLREATLRRKEAAIKRFGTALPYSFKQPGLVVRPQGPDAELATISQRLNRLIFCRFQVRTP
jgi:hypothetical protein